MTRMGENPGNTAPRRHPTAGFRIFEGQATIVMPDGSYIHVLNEIGSRVWDLLNGQRTEAEIVGLILEEFDTTPDIATRDVREFLATLEANHMLA
jgi:hypothetical protein